MNGFMSEINFIEAIKKRKVIKEAKIKKDETNCFIISTLSGGV